MKLIDVFDNYRLNAHHAYMLMQSEMNLAVLIHSWCC
jgi:hypothetical protein